VFPLGSKDVSEQPIDWQNCAVSTKTEAFYPCPLNMSIAWTYRPPSVHFLAEFGHIYGRGRCSGSVNLRISLPFRELIALYWRIGKDIRTRQAVQG
jgi:hypothetical protein